jgi:hypothetical protein
MENLVSIDYKPKPEFMMSEEEKKIRSIVRDEIKNVLKKYSQNEKGGN